MDPALESICERHGVFLRREAEALGYHGHAITRLLKDDVWHRVRHGAYTFTRTWDDLDARRRYGLLCRAAQRQSNTRTVLSHHSSTNEWSAPLWDADLSEVHLTRIDGKTGRREAGIRQHRGSIIEGDIVERNGLAVVSATRAALEITTLADVEHSMVEIDDLLHRGLTNPEKLASRFELMNSWPDTLRTDLILRLVDGRSESVGETRTRYLCWAYGLPAPIPNYAIRDREGRVIARVDLAWPQLGLFLEFDGTIKYGALLRDGESAKDVIMREQRREELICQVTGWRCIRVVWADLYRPAQTAARIRALFRPMAA